MNKYGRRFGWPSASCRSRCRGRTLGPSHANGAYVWQLADQMIICVNMLMLLLSTNGYMPTKLHMLNIHCSKVLPNSA